MTTAAAELASPLGSEEKDQLAPLAAIGPSRARGNTDVSSRARSNTDYSGSSTRTPPDGGSRAGKVAVPEAEHVRHARASAAGARAGSDGLRAREHQAVG
ncbi:unnamed protein product [Prorocentrum cordatum]|uniref:Uncharacterized protein n=1 Tax=Prorocentrum cordatum TaxID=2364126 RepID=A0ABN9PTQ6_9DINO|nr:unnamed protein product [Polarella glacialis]